MLKSVKQRAMTIKLGGQKLPVTRNVMPNNRPKERKGAMNKGKTKVEEKERTLARRSPEQRRLRGRKRKPKRRESKG